MGNSHVDPQAYQLSQTFAHLLDDGGIRSIPVDASFWTDGIHHLPPGRLISLMDIDADWTSWEMHPQGDE